MSLPPLHLLLPHVQTFDDRFSDFPLHVQSPTSAALLVLCLLHHVSSTTTRKTIILNLLDKDRFSDGLLDRTQCSLARFFRGDACYKGKFIQASGMISIVHIPSLFELRQVLLLFLMEADKYKEPTRQEIPDSQASVSLRDADVPILAIFGMDEIHKSEETALWSAQSLSQTCAAAVDAASAMNYHLIIHDIATTTADEIPVLDASSSLPPGLINLMVSKSRIYQRFMKYAWTVVDAEESGEWIDYRTMVKTKCTWSTLLDGQVDVSRYNLP